MCGINVRAIAEAKLPASFLKKVTNTCTFINQYSLECNFVSPLRSALQLEIGDLSSWKIYHLCLSAKTEKGNEPLKLLTEMVEGMQFQGRELCQN